MSTEREAKDIRESKIRTDQRHPVPHGMVEDRSVRLAPQATVDDVIGFQPC